MRPHATREEIDHVSERIREFGYKVHSIEGEERVVIGVVGMGDVTACLESLEATPGVERAVRISAPYKFVSKEFKKERTQMRINGLEIGADEFIVMAGPCSVESERQIMTTAEGVRKAGARILRGGAFKPRTSPYDFQGLELEGLKLLRKAKQATGLAIITEVMSDPSHATGKRSLVAAVARAAVAIGADGLLVEVHPQPEKAVSDGAQSLTLEQFGAMMRQLEPFIELWKEARVAEAPAVAV